jgi:hypothetical protein
VPPSISNTTVALASPAYQLHRGLYEWQYAVTGSAWSRKRAESKAWMAMSTSSGYAISSRYPPNRSDRKNAVLTVPIGPSRAIIARSAASCGFHRRDWLTMNSSPVTSAAAASDSARPTFSATGFSPSTGRPANNAAVVTGWCASGMVTLISAWAPVCWAKAVASVPTGRSGSPAESAASRARATSRSAMPVSVTSGESVTVASHARPMPPAPTMTTRSGSAALEGIVRNVTGAVPCSPGR